MGNSLPKEQQMNLETGTFDGGVWDKIGTKLWNVATGTDTATAKRLPVWHQVSEALTQIRKEAKTDPPEHPEHSSALPLPPPCNPVVEKSDPGEDHPFDPGPVNLEKELNLYPPDDELRGVVGGVAPTQTVYYGALEQCRKEALAKGDAELLQAFPVTY
ncbi:endogenous retrovirus group k member 8 gag poly [Limosa lapponica baueri]|uniref:Endogenous retrovirus group k member 8 gag poly n=1 Tax=Limosa lapponica baueri TaxID=1758121 RepID=A0A2I0TAU6_LIMLA|nr:endogenous retrovirus group k member 8 gag poly [Limosa lapponica baueri]